MAKGIGTPTGRTGATPPLFRKPPEGPRNQNRVTAGQDQGRTKPGQGKPKGGTGKGASNVAGAPLRMPGSKD